MTANDPAFPEIKSQSMIDNEFSPVASVWSEGGLTKREWFAGMAMQGLLVGMTSYTSEELINIALNAIPKTSAQMADALIKELEK